MLDRYTTCAHTQNTCASILLAYQRRVSHAEVNKRAGCLPPSSPNECTHTDTHIYTQLFSLKSFKNIFSDPVMCAMDKVKKKEVEKKIKAVLE